MAHVYLRPHKMDTKLKSALYVRKILGNGNYQYKNIYKHFISGLTSHLPSQALQSMTMKDGL